MSVPSDNPIEHAAEDSLGRAPAAKAFAQQVLALDASKGVVVGVLGPWGAGKTSFVNMAREDFAQGRANVFAFNPWMFSGAEQLVESFFAELSAKLKLRPGLEQIGEDLADYGEAFSSLAWVPLVGPWVERGRWATKVLAKILKRRREGTEGRRAKLTDELARLDHPIIVVLDDIDRLSTTEIRDVFKLVRLTASFPNVAYVLAFDRARVEDALTDQGVPGRDYLEKILQIAIDLPTVPEEVLDRQVFSALDQAIADAGNPAEVDEQVWPDVYVEIIRPLIRNMRDVRRYAAAVRGAVVAVGDQIALTDLLALEAIRTFLPDLFVRMQASVEGLCTPAQWVAGGGDDPPRLKEAIDRLVATASEDHQEVVRALIQRLFPFADRHFPGGTNYGPDHQKVYLRNRRVAHDAILRLYLERVAGQTLTNFYDAERAWGLMEDRDSLDTFLRKLVEPDRLEDVVRALETYEDEYRPEQVVPTSIVLLNLTPIIPERPRGMFAFDIRMVIGRVVYRLLRSLPDHDSVEGATRQILPELDTLSEKWELILKVGYQENAGHKLVSEDAARELEAQWRTEVRAASATGLAAEGNLTLMLYFAQKEAGEDEPKLEIPDDPAVTLAVLAGAKSDALRQTMGNRAVQREPRLSWDTLVEVYGNEETLGTRLESLKRSDIDTDSTLIDLADKYASGWRPE